MIKTLSQPAQRGGMGQGFSKANQWRVCVVFLLEDLLLSSIFILLLSYSKVFNKLYKAYILCPRLSQMEGKAHTLCPCISQMESES